MIDNISHLGFAEVAPAAAITSTAAVGSSINLLSLQAQGTIGFVLDAVLSTGSTSSITTKLQSSPDNSTWTDITGGAFLIVSDTLHAGVQTLFIDSSVIGQYIRASDTAAGSSPSVTRSVTAVYLVKNK